MLGDFTIISDISTVGSIPLVNIPAAARERSRHNRYASGIYLKSSLACFGKFPDVS